MMTDQNLAGLDDTLNQLYPKKIKAVSTLDQDFHDYTADEDLIRYGHEKRYILLTCDVKSITRRKYPPCKHGGIIKMPGMPSKQEVLLRLQKLVQSGPRYLKQIRAHFTHLRSDGATIYKEHDEIVEVTFA
jgi:hypothetical protein